MTMGEHGKGVNLYMCWSRNRNITGEKACLSNKTVKIGWFSNNDILVHKLELCRYI